VVAKNIYNSENQYSSINLNALSNGDDKGKGDVNGQVGSLTDINVRTEVVAKNKYNDAKGYPDFVI
jgi:hypothetical protein